MFEVGGPEELSMRDVVALYQSVLGREIRVAAMLEFVLRTLRAIVKPFSEAAFNILAINCLTASTSVVVPAVEVVDRFGMQLTTAERFLRSKMQHREAEPG